ncbi:MFS transporter [Nocardioides jishulii]|uniref:MFS transporter n=2 Tax=Nocardioides jishulii TaxID=2575440 RepID=A0A4U2YUU7_9ACTN|nr:MFS transporter [Nocardioides jishulii]TKI64864.1 MFS transporter [Nocardioides jishulii]
MAVSLQQTLVVPLVPDLPLIFGTTADTASWLLTITLLTGAVATPIVTKLADMHGKRRMIVLALSIMVVGSLLLALTTSLVAAMVGRALQGLAAAVIPIGISVLRDELPPERVGFGIALMSATLGIGGALGLPLSGFLYEQSGWASIFWVSAGVTATILVGIFLVVPESPVRSPGSFDLVGAVVLSAALTALMLVISKGSVWGWLSGTTLGLLALSALTFAAWVPMQLRRSEPMVDLRTAASRPVLLTNVASVLVTVGMMANGLLTIPMVEAPLSSGHGFGVSVMTAGLLMAPSGLAMVAFAPVSGCMLNRVGGRRTLILGAVVVALSYFLRPAADGSLTAIVVVSTLCGLGAAIAFAAMPALIMSAVPITETASANGINSLMRAVGMAAASAGTAAIFASLATATTVDGTTVTAPTSTAFTVGFMVCGVFAAVGAVVAAFIPTRSGAVPQPGSGAEKVVRGQVVLGSAQSEQVLGTVVLTRPDGQQVDWARPDFDGHFSLAFPRDGRYLLVATARGWAPRVAVTDLTADCATLRVPLDDRLTVGGVVTCDGDPVAGATVTMFLGSGEHTGHTTTDEDGRYAFPLPPSGLYLVAAALPETGAAHAEKVQVMAESVVADLALEREAGPVLVEAAAQPVTPPPVTERSGPPQG